MLSPICDDHRAEVWDAIVKAGGDRVKAAKLLGVHFRTLNRYINQYDLFDQIEKAGYMLSVGPPRVRDGILSKRKPIILEHIIKTGGRVNFAELANLIYGDSTRVELSRVYSAVNELKGAGVIGFAEGRYFVLDTPIASAIVDG